MHDKSKQNRKTDLRGEGEGRGVMDFGLSRGLQGGTPYQLSVQHLWRLPLNDPRVAVKLLSSVTV